MTDKPAALASAPATRPLSQEVKADTLLGIFLGGPADQLLGMFPKGIPWDNFQNLADWFNSRAALPSVLPLPHQRYECKNCNLRIYLDKSQPEPAFPNGRWRHHGSNFIECFQDLSTWAEPKTEAALLPLSAEQLANQFACEWNRPLPADTPFEERLEYARFVRLAKIALDAAARAQKE